MLGERDGGRYDWECPPEPEDGPPTCLHCGAPIPTGDPEPASGLCPTCEEVDADKQAAHDRHDAAVDARRTAEECAYDAELDDSREHLLWPVRNRNEYEGREDFEE